MANDSFGASTTLSTGSRDVEIYSLKKLDEQVRGDVFSLPFSIRVLLESLLRNNGSKFVDDETVEMLSNWPDTIGEELPFLPARVVMQDFTGVPAVVDLAAMRSAMDKLGGDPAKINPLVPSDLVIDHSVQVDVFGNAMALQFNAEREFERNKERYEFLKWGQQAFDDFTVVPPATGIVHQVNLEYLAKVVQTRDGVVFPDTLVGTDSHTTMINGLGVLGWGVGGIEAEAVMLGQPYYMLVPEVIGFKLTGGLREGVTATDLVLTVTQILRSHGVVGKFVEFYGDGLSKLTLADRATIANMSPEFGATTTFFPVDAETLKYLRGTGRDEELVDLVERYYKEQNLFRTDETPEPRFSETLELELASVEASLAGPRRPQDRVALEDMQTSFRQALAQMVDPDNALVRNGGNGEWEDPYDEADAESFPASDTPNPDIPVGGDRRPGVPRQEAPEGTEDDYAEESAESFPSSDAPADMAGVTSEGEGDPAAGGAQTETPEAVPEGSVTVTLDGEEARIGHGSAVIAAITSCTNTSNPSVMIGAGLLAKKAVEKGLTVEPHVKTSLAPGSKVVTEYLEASDLLPYLERLKFNVVGYGCTTCIGNSGPLPEPISEAVEENDLVVAAVLSGNRNFEGRINPDVKANYLASPPLVVAYALAGRVDVDLANEPLGEDEDGNPVYLKDIWPSQEEVREQVESSLNPEMFNRQYADVYTGNEQWNEVDVPEGDLYEWDPDSTYVKEPNFFDDLSPEPEPLEDIEGACVLVKVGDSVTTDHISPAGAIPRNSPAGQYLLEKGVEQREFNSFGSRRGNHEVMVRGTFGNIRLRNQLRPGTEGGVTVYFPENEETTVYEASMKYQEEGIPLVVLAGKEYGSGSSRDWAAKGTFLLGVKAVIAESFERIHRSNLIGMGVLPLQFAGGESAESLGLDGTETYDIEGISGLEPGKELTVRVRREDGDEKEFTTIARVDSPVEVEYLKNGGILHTVLRQLLNEDS
ncbi:MAG: aconitate hydratase AcnA [Actinomycetota bacterium]|nr:aconitate hydratase AcnA [Actinomycetota bacterium]